VDEDLGRPIAHLALQEGTPVYDADGKKIGVVDRVVHEGPNGIFEGLVVHTLPLPGHHRFADHEQVDTLFERGVTLNVRREDLHELARPRHDDDTTPESPLQARLRKAWDLISGAR
jgi:uncharacterized protein YrrD